VAMRVEHVIVAVVGHVILKEAEAISVDGSHEHRTKTILEAGAQLLGDTKHNALLEFGGGFLCECEGD
jgi:hypothetical protein